MSNTPKEADEVKRILEEGWEVRLYKNSLGSYTAEASREHVGQPENAVGHREEEITDDFEPSQALYRLTKKVIGEEIESDAKATA